MTQPITQRERKYQKEQWSYGWKLAENYQPMSLCTNEYQRNGYRAACNAAAYAETSAYLVTQGVMR